MAHGENINLFEPLYFERDQNTATFCGWNLQFSCNGMCIGGG